MVIMVALALTTLASVHATSPNVRVKRRPVDQPHEGMCSNFWWGGISKVHFYTCCNNLDEGPNPYCDGRTYHRASNGSYCKPGGFDGGNGEQHESYRCGGCDGQARVAEKCEPWPSLDVVGTCWVFTKCFTDFCEKRYRVNGLNLAVRDRPGMPDTCYNGKCDVGETTDNCPVDCCYTKNKQCTWGNKCTQLFCATPSCGVGWSGGDGVFTAGTYGIKILAAAVLVLGVSIVYFFRRKRQYKRAQSHNV
ncbi:uncharacterized protein LOC124266548 [Haliotis rubra]|uniref:uncharacterized protein LOC124266548 n=1 Tax=Haliotis rubra TaxID=36100 RepID=UPI001EE60548|nr:uncharacterized protein LOC124266548 [Haliotis rubra]XP_046557305.1 uncharacterized protein LOC124266548 [Haliotis rubra]